MATQTQTLQKNAVQPYRVHDYLYGKCMCYSDEANLCSAMILNNDFMHLDEQSV